MPHLPNRHSPPLEGLALDGNAGVTQAAFLALGEKTVGAFLERRRATKSKGLWLAPGASSFGFCGIDHVERRRDVSAPSGASLDRRLKKYVPGGGRLGGE